MIKEAQKKIIHYVIYKGVNGLPMYLCNQACNTTPEKLTKFYNKVTCKNCLKIIENKQR